jgi:cystathionine beta-lyase/cystathionine gamma-synthase
MTAPRKPKHDSFLGPTAPLVPPLYQSSVYTLPDLDALDRIVAGEEQGFIYARDGHPNSRQLANALIALEKADWAMICSSGMAAISAPILALVKPGDRIVASHRLYGRTTQLFSQELTRFGVATTFIDTGDLDQVRQALAPPAQLLFVETMSNPMLRVADTAALAKLAHERNCLLMVDNTFATPVLQRPLEAGADLVMESLTKMIAGHSDVTLGVVCGRGDLLAQVSQVVSIWGFAANPFDCWLALRGLETLSLRMQAACANAAALATWLVDQPGVARVVYPGLSDHPDHALATRLFATAPGNMLCFELAGGRDAVNRFLHHAPGIPFSPSLGHTRTTCSHPAATSHRYVSAADRKKQGITDGLIRLSVGVEEIAETKAEMHRGLA